jgi:hypothetical protein
MQQVIPPSLLFDFSLTIHRVDEIPKRRKQILNLPETTRLPIPAQLNSVGSDFEIRVAWNPNGLGIAFSVGGRAGPPRGSGKSLKRCDHALLFVDTRHTATVHRAGSYCCGFVAIPCDDEANGKPSLAVRTIAQQRDLKQTADVRKCSIRSHISSTGYSMEVWLPASQLYGFAEVPDIGHLGFCCLIHDSESGELPLNLGDDFPVTFDPSTWLRLGLEK